MLNTIYRLVKPRNFEIEFEEIDLNDDVVIVRPSFLSICNADQRYYQGKRAPEVLKKKLPMELIHEAVGEVVYDSREEFDVGQKVVMIPNTPFEKDSVIAENYLRSSKFRASGFDGFMQDNVAMRRDRLIELPDNIDLRVGAFIEIISVSYHTVQRFLKFSHRRKDSIAIWGDGNLAFLVSIILKHELPDVKLYIMGIHDDKMAGFVFAEDTFHVNEIPENMTFDHAFECVGGQGCEMADNQIIDYIRPEGSIALMGVSENRVPLNTRMVLEKGLKIFGTSRSGYEDFKNTVEFLSQNDKAAQLIANLIDSVIDVRSVEDMNRAFESDIKKAGGKTIMKWNV